MIAVDPQGTAIAANGLRFELLRETWEYRWYSVNGVWRHKIAGARASRSTPARSMSRPMTPATLARQLPAGRYRWEVTDAASGAQSSLRFHVGWWVEAEQPDVPDKLEAALDKPSYQPGETAKLFIKAPFAGEAELAIASDRILSLRALSLPAEGATLDIPVDAVWGSGVYALVSAYRPYGRAGAAAARAGARRRGRLARDRRERRAPSRRRSPRPMSCGRAARSRFRSRWPGSPPARRPTSLSPRSTRRC